MSKLTEKDIVFRDPKLNFSEIDGEVVMLSIKNNEYYGLDEIGSVIWKKLETPTKIKELISALLSEFEVTEDECRDDTLEFVNGLYEKQLIFKK